MTSPAEVRKERAALRQLVKSHDGNLSAAARALTDSGTPITRPGLTLKLERLGLLGASDRLREKHNVPGPRTVKKDPGERTRLLDALAKHSTVADAADKLGMSRRKLFVLKGEHKITAAAIKRRRSLLAPA